MPVLSCGPTQRVIISSHQERLVIKAILAPASSPPDLTAITYRLPLGPDSGHTSQQPIGKLSDDDSLDKSFDVSQAMQCKQLA